MADLQSMQNAGVSHAPAMNKVLKNTYLLLSMTLAFSAAAAVAAIALNIGSGMAIGLWVVGFILMFVVHKKADSAASLPFVFAFTGCMGASIGPMLQHYLAMPGGTALVFQALTGTAVVFLGLSAYALTSKKDFSYMGGFLITGLIVVVIASIANIFLQIPIMSLVISSAVVLIMSGLILFDTSRIINGGETNYVRATVSMYLNIFNLFIHLLHLLGVMGDD